MHFALFYFFLMLSGAQSYYEDLSQESKYEECGTKKSVLLPPMTFTLINLYKVYVMLLLSY